MILLGLLWLSAWEALRAALSFGLFRFISVWVVRFCRVRFCTVLLFRGLLCRKWLGKRPRALYILGLGWGSFSVVTFGFSCEWHISFEWGAVRGMPISAYFCSGCVWLAGLVGDYWVCYGCLFGRLCAYRLNSSWGQASPISVYFGLGQASPISVYFGLGISVYLGLGCVGSVGFGSQRLCCSAPRCVQRAPVSERMRCSFGGWGGAGYLWLPLGVRVTDL